MADGGVNLGANHATSRSWSAGRPPAMKADLQQHSAVPFLKWPGGKREIARNVVPRLKSTSGRYFEPFLGGGAMFFAVNPSTAFLADKNEELINCYRQVRDMCSDLIDCLGAMKNSEGDYYRIRGWEPDTELERAARLIYLCTLSFNGIHRVNLAGQFNVPYGKKTHLLPCNPQLLQAVSRRLKTVTLYTGDFKDAIASATEGDLVYLDPPYTVAHRNNGFVKYNAKIFSWEDQHRLAKVASQLAGRGCKVLVSNADHPSIHALYPHFKLEIIERPSRIAASSRFRTRITESLFHNGVLAGD